MFAANEINRRYSLKMVRTDQRLDLQIHRGVVRRFENYFEGRIGLHRRGQNPLLAAVDDSVARGEAIDGGVDVSRENFSSLRQRRSLKIFGYGLPAHKAVETVAGVIGMELD